MTGEQHGLLGIRAIAADDDERNAVALGRGVHAIEGRRDVRSHRLALAVRERSAVLAGTGRPERDVGRGGELGLGARARLHPLASADLDRIAHLDAHAHGSERVVVGKRHADVVRTVAASGGERRPPAALQIGGPLDVRAVGTPADLARLEEPGVGVVHRASARQRAEVRRALLVALRADALRDRPEHEGAEQHGERDAEQQDRGLAGLAAADPARSARRSV